MNTTSVAGSGPTSRQSQRRQLSRLVLRAARVAPAPVVAHLERWAKMSSYESTWWSLELPVGWSGEEDDGCHTILPTQGVGAFQVSVYRKEEGVTDDDLREFAGDIPLHALRVGEFTGFRTRLSDGDTFWIKWWLRADHAMLHASYNCRLSERSEGEERVVDQIVDSLALVR